MEVQDTLSGCDDISTLEINDLQEYPLIVLEEATNLDCINTNVLIDGSNSQQNQFILYNWYDENGLIAENADLTIMVSNPGWYYFEATDTVNGCQNIDSIQILDLSDLPEIELLSQYALNCRN